MSKQIISRMINDNCYITKTTIDGKITFANDKFLQISEYTQDELLGQNHSILKSFDTSVEVFKNLWETILDGQIWNGTIKNISKSGREFFMETTIYPVVDEQTQQILEFIAFRNDLTHYIDLLRYDRLTGLKNRESLKQELQISGEYLCCIVNIDHFSDVVDFYGGDVADLVLQETARRLVKIFIGHEIYRLQGDEFAIVKKLPSKYDVEFLQMMVSSKVRAVFDEIFYIEENELVLTATSGMGIDSRNSLRNANIAFKEAKSKNISFIYYHEDMLAKFANFTQNKQVAQDIKKALKEDTIVPFYQPIVDNSTKKIVKYEALARLVKEEKVVPPGAFLDVSKKIKYYHQITRAILTKTFENFKLKNDVGVSINLTIEDISNVRTFNLIVELLSQHKNNQNITFELVESDGIEDFELFDTFARMVKKYNAKISIDDFGTGYSNFSYLAKIEPDFLKIDGSLIKNIHNSKDFDVVKAIIDFAKLYNIKTVAEFVEDEEIYILVKELGIDYSQGYYFGKPTAIQNI